jgi:hypothetical protein
MMQYIAGAFVWITLIATNVGVIFGAFWFYLYWQNQKASLDGTIFTVMGSTSLPNGLGISSSNLVTASTVSYLEAAFYIIAILAGVLLLLTLAMIKRVQMAVGVIKQASYAMMKMPLIVFFPLVTFVLIATLFTYFLLIGVYIVTPKTTPATLSLGSSWSWTDQNVPTASLGIHVFGFLWTLFWFMGINQVTLAGAFAQWYWSIDKKAKLILPVTRSFLRTLRYNLGSIATGALLIAIVEFIRIILAFALRYAKKIKSRMLVFIIACVQCIMSCVSQIVKFINRNAYIMIAVTGQPFFKAAGHATGLLTKNALRVAAVDFVSGFVILLSKIIVCIIPAIGCYIYILSNTSTYSGVVYPQVTVALIALGAFLIASAFFSIYEMGIDTIFLCFLEDLDRNDGSPQKPYYMPDALAKLMGIESVSSPKKTTILALSPEKISPTSPLKIPTELPKIAENSKSRSSSVKKVNY